MFMDFSKSQDATKEHNLSAKTLEYLDMNWKWFEFFRNYTKLAVLVVKAYIGKNKINSAKIVTSSGDWTWYLLYSTMISELTWQGLWDWDF